MPHKAPFATDCSLYLKRLCYDCILQQAGNGLQRNSCHVTLCKGVFQKNVVFKLLAEIYNLGRLRIMIALI